MKQMFINMKFHVMIHIGVVNNGRRSIHAPVGGVMLMGQYEFLSLIFFVTICIAAIKA